MIAGGVQQTVRFVRERQHLLLQHRGQVLRVRDLSRVAAAAAVDRGGDGALRASTNGRVVAVLVQPGAHVVAGQAMVTLEAMKMEHVHAAPHAGVVCAVHVSEGEQVALGRVVAEIA